MPKHRKKILSLFVLLTLTVAGTLAAFPTRSQNEVPTSREKTDEGQDPVIDYEAEEAINPQRGAKGKRYNGRGIADASFKASGVLYSTVFETRAAGQSPIPVADSDAVVIAEVTGVQAFLSPDKTGIYSDFTLHVEEVLKDASPALLKVGSSIIADREGGSVRFPSGNVVRHRVADRALLRVGKRYVLFLKANDAVHDFHIVKAFQLQGGHVVSIDGVGTAKHPCPYEGTPEASFLGTVRETIARCSQGGTCG